MAAVLEFPPQTNRRFCGARQQSLSHDGGCEIVIFPGVRRERCRRETAPRAAEAVSVEDERGAPR